MILDWLLSLRTVLSVSSRRRRRTVHQSRTFRPAIIERLEPRQLLNGVIANADNYQVQTPQQTPIVLDVLANDTSATGSALTITSVQAPAHGSVSIQRDPMAAMYAMYGMPGMSGAPDTLLFNPSSDFSGTETFGYTVSDSAGNQSMATVTLTVISVPQVSGMTSTSGSTVGGANVSINGSGFGQATQVLFGNTQAFSFTINSDSSITAVAPSHAVGSVDVHVVTPTGTSATSMYGLFTYVTPATPPSLPTVTSVSPGTENISGGDSIVNTGTGFTNVMSVTFGGTSATGYMVMSDTTIIATAPAHVAGQVNVQITTMMGSSQPGLSDVLLYTSPAQPPVVNSLMTSSGSTAGGTRVIIQGANFNDVAAVWFGNQQATSFVVNSPISITAVSPAHSAGSVNVQVVSSVGSSGTSMFGQFSFVAPVVVPTVSGVSPGTETLSGGNTITITGAGFP